MAGRKEIPREISIYVNDVQVVNSFTGINRAIRQTNNEIGALNKNSATYDEDLQRLKTTLGELKEKQSEFKEEINDTNGSLGEVKEAFSKIFTGLQSGDLETAKEGLTQIRGSIVGMTKSALAFVATPIGATIAVFSTLAIVTKEIFDFNQKLQESNNLLQALGLQGAEMSKVRSEIQATAESFDKDFREIAEKAKSLSETYGFSMSEANALISRGLAEGGAQNSEFLDSIGEYDEFFKQAGYSAEDFIAIVNKGPNLGIYSDKLPDALKEADLSLKEGVKSSRDALFNAFGATFTDEILAKVATGTITTREALEQINIKAKESNLSQQQMAQLTADIFKGAGEDAGGALKVMEALGTKASTEVNAATKASLDLVAANEKLNKAQAALFEIEGFGTMWTSIKAESIDALSSILEWIIDIKKDIQPLIDFVGVAFVHAWHTLKLSVQIVYDVIGGVFKGLTNYVSTFFNFWKKIITGDFSGALNVLRNGFINLGNIVKDTFAKIKNHVIDGLKSIVSNVAPFLEAIGFDVEKIQKRLDSLKSKTVVLKTTPENGKPTDDPEPANTKALNEELAKQKALRDAARQKEIDAHQKELDKKKAAQEKHDKELHDKAIAVVKAKTDLAKAELDNFIANNRSKIDKEKALTPEIIAEETKRLDNIKFQQQNALVEKRLIDIEKANQEVKSAEEIAALKRAIDLEYLTSEQNLEFQFLESTTALKKQYEEQQKQIAAEQLIAENQIKEAALNEEFAKKQELENQKYAAEKLGLEKKEKEGLITKNQYLKLLKIAEDNHSKAVITISRAERDARISAYGEMFGSIAKLLGENTAAGKAAALAQVAISQGLAVAKIWEQESTLPSPFDIAAKVAGTAVAVANVVSAAKQINSVKTPKFFYGGFNNSDGSGGSTGTVAHLGNDEFGKITGVTHDEEWIAPKVMTQSPKYAATFSWLENERKKAVGNKFFSGGESSPGTVAPYLDAPDSSTVALLIAVNRLNDHLDKGIEANARIGYKEAKEIKELNDERELSNQYGTVSQ